EGFRKDTYVVYLDKIHGTGSTSDAPAVMNQRHNTYLPRILPVVVGSKVAFHSEDPELHNAYARSLSTKNDSFNLGITPKSPPFLRTFSKEEVVKLTCNVHKEMLAFILVLPNPYFAVVEKGQDQFHLEGIPPGQHQLRIWGEKLEEPMLAKTFPITVTAGPPV